MKVVHLVDDKKPGGVQVMIDRLRGLGFESQKHSVMFIKRGKFLAPNIDADLIISHLSMSWRNLPFMISLRNRHASTRLVHIEHSYCDGFEKNNVDHKNRFRNMLRISYSLFNSIVAVSNAQSNWMKQHNLVSAEQLLCVPNCIDLKKFPQRIASKRDGGPIRIAAMGRFHHQKGFDILVQAFLECSHQNMELHIIGAGEEESRLKEIANRNSKIIFHPFSQSPSEIYNMADFIAVPSRWEAFGLVAQEARASGCVVISSGVDGLKEQSVSNELIADPTVESWSKLISILPTLKLEAFIKRGVKSVISEEIRFILRWAEILQDEKAQLFRKCAFNQLCLTASVEYGEGVQREKVSNTAGSSYVLNSAWR